MANKTQQTNCFSCSEATGVRPEEVRASTEAIDTSAQELTAASSYSVDSLSVRVGPRPCVVHPFGGNWIPAGNPCLV